MKLLPFKKAFQPIGLRDEFTLDHRLFNFLCWVGGLFALSSIPANLILNLNPWITVATSFFAVILGLFYFLSRFKKIYKPLLGSFVVLMSIALSLLWFVNGGIKGVTPFNVIGLTQYYATIIPKGHRRFALIWHVLNVALLIIIEQVFPGLVIGYSNEQAHSLDLMFTFSSVGIIVYYGATQLRQEYREEIDLIEELSAQKDAIVRQEILYQESQQQIQELERLNSLKDDFLSRVSHELRTPVTNIKMAAQMLEISLNKENILNKEEDRLNPIPRYFSILKDECQREIQLINDLLEFTRIEDTQHPINFFAVSLVSVISGVSKPFIERTQQQHQTFALDIPPDLPALVTHHPYLERILQELIHNACKYTPAGEVISISVRVTHACQIRVRNSGVEISKSEQGKIFEKFYRIANRDPWKHGGTGLGLALVKELANRLGGSIWVESGHGSTTFVIELPLNLEPTPNPT